ncbi:MAG: hypothetical protein HY000_34620 [Planctomycetes bacterium]|nr:hypothetical protein [Planctomycetota bacterium]
MGIARSVNGVPIRLTAERWSHIVKSHDELDGCYDDVLRVVENPDLVLRESGGALLAVKGYGRNRYLTVLYRELSPKDGFIITAYFARRMDRGKVVWRR